MAQPRACVLLRSCSRLPFMAAIKIQLAENTFWDNAAWFPRRRAKHLHGPWVRPVLIDEVLPVRSVECLGRLQVVAPPVRLQRLVIGQGRGPTGRLPAWHF